MTFLDEIQWRGLLYQTAGQDIEAHLATPGRVAYCGFDPTKDSLTVGNFVAIKMLMHWQRAGHRPIALMGVGTGMIGDPSGKDAERQLLSPEQAQANSEGQRRVFERLLDFDRGRSNAALILNNYDWLGKLGYIDMLRDVGKYFSVNAMIQKDSVRERLHNRDQGISYTEFSYMLLQAYDFYHLRQTHGCTVQLAGSDQFGNIVAGIDLIRRKLGPEVGHSYAITNPLLTRSDGKKIGKSEDGAIWLTADRTSPYRFYQVWVNTDDADVIKFLKWFTFCSEDEIAAIEAEQQANAQARPAQRALARQMTALIHGEDALKTVEHASAALFGDGNVRGLDGVLLREVFADVPNSLHDKQSLDGAGVALVDVLAQSSLVASKREAREFLQNGAISVNGERVAGDRRLTASDLLHGETILLRRGRKNWHATRWV
ncbi:MAG: tyrosine--tRNA ligase [Gammaproteobacteria bacterium]